MELGKDSYSFWKELDLCEHISSRDDFLIDVLNSFSLPYGCEPDEVIIFVNYLSTQMLEKFFLALNYIFA